jgi:GTP-binding protein
MIIATLGAINQLDDLFNGPHLMGRNEPRVAFVGRSNVGKSSLINALVGGKNARVSGEPGKTRNVYFYLWSTAKKIVADLPGYGYAKQSKEERDRWATFIQAYLERDEGLERALVLLDSRHGPSDADLEAIRFLSEDCALSMLFIMTKFDQLKTQSDRALRKRAVTELMRNLGYGPENIFWVSVKDGTGIRELMAEIKKEAPPLRKNKR